MNTIKYINRVFFIVLSLFLMVGCDDTETSLQLNGDTWLKTLKLDEFQGVIDNSNKTVLVEVPVNYDTDAMEISAVEVSEGAQASMQVGEMVDFSFPQTIKVTNGDAFMEYTITVKHHEAKITSFKLNDVYTGIIDEENHSIQVRVPTNVNVKSLIPTIETTKGATVTPASGQAVDFTNPVIFTVTYETATSTYEVKVVQSDSPLAVYVGLASSIDELNPEEKAAATWMLKNISNSEYLSFDDVRTERVDLSGCKVMWWHFHVDGGIGNEAAFNEKAASAIQTVAKMKDFYENGGSLLLTRFATYYAAKMDVTADGKVPNNSWGGSEQSGETVTGPWSFFITGHTEHPLYAGITAETIDGKPAIYTCDKGYNITNSTSQWHIGWEDYADLNTWETNHGATSLGYGGDGAVVVWEYPSTASSGRVLCIGSGCYDWYSIADVTGDQYHENVEKLTQNAIEYLISESNK